MPFHISQLIPFCVARIISLKYITIIPFLWCFYYQYIFVMLDLAFECCLFFPYTYLVFSTCGPFSYFRAVERSSAELSWNSSADLRKSRAVYTHRKKAKLHLLLHLDTRMGLTHNKSHFKCKKPLPKPQRRTAISLTSSVRNLTKNTFRLNLPCFKELPLNSLISYLYVPPPIYLISGLCLQLCLSFMLS